jgi:hypothetical protein
MRRKNRFGSMNLNNMMHFEKSEDCPKKCCRADKVDCEYEQNQNYEEDEYHDGLVKPCDCPVCHE